MYCSYYQAIIDRQKTWFVVGALRSCEGLVFERTLSKEQNLFEFFVSPGMEPVFLSFMNEFAAQGLVRNLVPLPNRLEHEAV